MGFLFVLFLILAICGIAFRLTGAVLSTFFWFIFMVPLATVVMAIGLVFCCTIILLPIGILILKAGFHILVPG